MKKNGVLLSMAALLVLLLTDVATAHVPYFEHQDFSETKPFVVKKSVAQSIAVYSWLNFDREDVDVYTFSIAEPTRLYVETLVPVCVRYEDLLPSFAIVGPGLPAPEHADVPFDIPKGYGMIIVPNLDPGEDRESFHEPFGNKDYYQGPTFDEMIDTPGTYSIYVWDPHSVGGDYVAVIGYDEIWEPNDIARGLFYTPLIRNGKELHSEECK